MRLKLTIALLLLAFTINAQIPTNGLVAYYPFNGNANDESNNGNNATALNGPQYISDRYGKPNAAVYFDGTDDYFTVAPSPTLNAISGASDFTFCSWVKSTGDFFILCKTDGGSFQYRLLGNVNNGLNADFENIALGVSTILPYNDWFFLACVKKGSQYTFYKNGIPLGPPSVLSNGFSIGTNTPLEIGRDVPGATEYTIGALDEIRIYNRALSDQEVKQIYQAELPPADITTSLVAYYPFNENTNDESGNGNNSASNIPFTKDRFGENNKAINTTNNDVVISSNQNLSLANQSISISGWVNPNETWSSENRGAILCKGGYEWWNGYELLVRGDSKIEMVINRTTFQTIATIPLNRWSHVVGTFDNQTKNISVFIDGIKQEGNLYPWGDIVVNPSTEDAIIGQRNPASSYTNRLLGSVDEVRVYNRALSGIDVAALYGNYVSPEATPPQITISAASISAGQTVNIIGSGFTPLSQAEISIYDDFAYANVQSVNTNSEGAFNLAFNTNSDFATGFYNIVAVDISTSIYAKPGRNFYLNNNISITLPFTIQNPKLGTQYFVNDILNIAWSDLPLFILTGKTYKIEYSYNNSAWSEIKRIYKTVNVGQLNNFIFNQFTPNQVGDYQIKISNLSDPSESVLSDVISVLPEPNIGFDFRMDWDNSNNIKTETKVKGVAADGSARIYFKVAKKNTLSSPLTITKVKLSLFDPETSLLDYKLLGKLMPVSNADDLTKYSLEANNATAIEVSSTNTINNAFCFWYVAPDDFNRSLATDNFIGMRIVKVKIETFYNNSTTPDESLIKDLEIVRPPLMLVHGIGGDEDTWKNTIFSNANNITTHLREARNIFLAGIQANNLYKNVAFTDNANLLLGINRRKDLGDKTYQNSFQDALIKAKTIYGYAANRVDYVCHSMGGCVLRTAINTMPEAYNPSRVSLNNYKNYGAGFVNKLITLNTPHNGSSGADLIVERAPELPDFLKLILMNYYEKNGVLGTFLEETYDRNITINDNTTYASFFKYKATPAVKNMRYFKSDINTGEGVRFTETKVKNHLIAGKIASTNTEGVDYINHLYPYVKLGLKLIPKQTINFLLYNLLGNENSTSISNTNAQEIHDRINLKMIDYGIPSFIQSSDGVVPLSSQLPGKFLIDNTSTLFVNDGTYDYMHTLVTDQLPIGNRIVELLNKPISSDFFADKIAANKNEGDFSGGKYVLRPSSNESILNTTDSLLEYFDTTKIKIITPTYLSTGKIDSSFTVKLNLKDTANYKRTILIFQGEQYNTTSFADTLTFNLKVSPALIDSQIVMVAALYDSAGFSVYHYDLTKIIIKPDSLCKQLIVSPETKFLNPGEKYIPSLNGIHPTYITSISITDPAISFNIADSNVIRYDSAMNRFIAKDTGSTIIVFDYKGFKDTILIYLTIPTIDISFTPKICPGQTINYTTDDILGATYQWLVDNGNGFTNLSNDAKYSGTTTNTLTITNIPTSNRGNKYQCITVNGPGSIYSDTKTLQFGVTWNGTTNTDWSNPANWNCNVIPDEYVDVIIPTGKLNYPTVNSNVNVNSLKLENGAKVTVAPSAMINVKSKQ